MFDKVLGVVLGLFSAYTILSLFCSVANEWIARYRAYRSQTLEDGIRTLLGDDAVAKDLMKEFYRHPLIAGYARPGRFDQRFQEDVQAKAAQGLSLGAGRPSYIPATNFALVLFDLVATYQGPAAEVAAAGSPTPPAGASPAGASAVPLTAKAMALAKLRADVKRIGASQTGRVLRVLLDDAGDDYDKAVTNVKTWFNDGMDRVSGQYKRNTQMAIVILALIITAGFNLDSFALADTLWTNSETGLSDWHYTAGWGDPVQKVAGLLLTVVAISMGAPFWFDLIGKVSSLRGAGPLPTSTVSGDGAGTASGGGVG